MARPKSEPKTRVAIYLPVVQAKNLKRQALEADLDISAFVSRVLEEAGIKNK